MNMKEAKRYMGTGIYIRSKRQAEGIGHQVGDHGTLKNVISIGGTYFAEVRLCSGAHSIPLSAIGGIDEVFYRCSKCDRILSKPEIKRANAENADVSSLLCKKCRKTESEGVTVVDESPSSFEELWRGIQRQPRPSVPWE
ncbi:MAG: hypothetical protein ISS36_04705 [Candidatus Aenigmarchaeota archaeon]|nr:hypothetical protein [Candidatus Aenigmarchaeota archaeon]